MGNLWGAGAGGGGGFHCKRLFVVYFVLTAMKKASGKIGQVGKTKSEIK